MAEGWQGSQKQETLKRPDYQGLGRMAYFKIRVVTIHFPGIDIPKCERIGLLNQKQKFLEPLPEKGLERLISRVLRPYQKSRYQKFIKFPILWRSAKIGIYLYRPCSPV